ncbi:hypothetical protein [Streptomyces venezuelae]|uniref:hypothetical protein n=3 Tax=Streptomyces TaxID=1883 RepID=UPI00090207E9|nr:hypothetical protein [Streptomyces venezuelae]APE25579.1 hypothetical protein vnz_34175 [Streptomyces venezuelae]QES02917.1 hypothetical protein DEJ43_34740 [Streptomyces venezuelae ATCC 10712]
MHDPKLTHQERKLLEGIEAGLRSDESLSRKLHTFGHAHAGAGGAWGVVGRHRLGWCAAGLGAACVALFVLAVASTSTVPLWLFSAVWVVTAVCLMRLGMLAIRRRARGAGRASGAESDGPQAREGGSPTEG